MGEGADFGLGGISSSVESGRFVVLGQPNAYSRGSVISVEQMPLSRVPSDVLSLTRPGVSSSMKQWVSEAKQGDSEGIAWLAYEGPFAFLTNHRLVGWACTLDGEFSIYVKPSERRRGIGEILVNAIGNIDSLIVKPHNRIAERFFEKHGFSF